MRTYQVLQVYWLIDLLSAVSVLQGKDEKNIPYCEVGPCYTVNLPCDNKGKVKQCYTNAKLLREKDYRYILQDTFNKLRNNVAGGKTYRNLPTAARMGRMIWNKELAYFAKLDVSRCEVSPRPCMSSSNFDLISSLAGVTEYVPDNSTSKMAEAIQSIALNWFKDIRSITRLDTLHLAVAAKESGILSAALLLIEHNTQFGCAALRYWNDVYYYVILSCVFGTDNQDGQWIYKWGVSPGINCRRQDKTYINLCARGETYETKKPKTHFARIRKDW
ncbi:allergen Tab y 5.0101 [Drosophila innubila]|uniref:allergen Tab y 5.0101 n=1 Tax=Drosophila innubila TaxID=198719 RepID=UPI00148C4AC8|nr:allergen Tab y 5.0101 [Drosophila innubila]